MNATVKQTNIAPNHFVISRKQNKKIQTKIKTKTCTIKTNYNRRRFLGVAAMSLAAAEFVTIGSADGQSSVTTPNLPEIKSGTYTSFASMKQINADLNVGYAEAGPAEGPAVVLLHGWPYDIYSFVDVGPLLASAGYRVIVPFLRGYGTTRFLSSETFRNASSRPSPSTSSL